MFSHRSAGELVVAFAHSLLVVQFGALAMGGSILGRDVLQLSLPLLFVVLMVLSLSFMLGFAVLPRLFPDETS
jgi:hypothetical protein